MIETYRIFEVGCYFLLNQLPFSILALCIFHNSLRFSKKTIVFLLSAVTFIQIGINIWVTFLPNATLHIISLLCTLLYAVFFIISVKTTIGKLIFIMLFLSNLANYIMIVSKCLEGQLFPVLAVQPYRWSFSLSLLIIYTVLFIPLYLYIQKIIVPMTRIPGNDADWHYLWLIPAIFYFIWYCGLYLIKNRSSLEIALLPRNTILFTCFTAGAFFIYFITAKLLTTHEHNRILQEQNASAAIQLLQHQNLQEKIQETRHIRHDLRHHVTLMNSYLQNHEYEKLENYLSYYTKVIFDLDAIKLCNNNTLNLILLYFASLAKENDISFVVEANINEDLPVSESDLSVLFGNLLENALDACISDSAEHKEIVVRINQNNSSLCLTIDNTYHGQIKKTKNNQFLSTKHSGYGLGIKSSENIVEHYNGTMKIEQQNDTVFVSALLFF